MHIFTKALRAKIRNRGGVRLVQGTPPIVARKYREGCLRQVASRGTNIIARRFLLTILHNGDWRRHQVELFVPSDFALTPEKAEVVVANGLVTALAGHVFELYPRSRWCGADLALDR